MYLTKQISLFLMLLTSGAIYASDGVQATTEKLQVLRIHDRKVGIRDLTGRDLWVTIAPEGNTAVEVEQLYKDASGSSRDDIVRIIQAINSRSSHLEGNRKYTYEELSQVRLYAVKYSRDITNIQKALVASDFARGYIGHAVDRAADS